VHRTADYPTSIYTWWAYLY